MKRLIIRILTLSILLFPGLSSLAQDKADAKSAITAANTERIQVMKSGDYEKLEKFYDNNAIVMPNNRPVEQGLKAIMESYDLRKKGGYKFLDVQFTALATAVAGDFYIETGNYTLKASFPGPPEPVTEVGKYQTIWKIQKDQTWKIYSDIWNFDKSANMQQKKSGIEVNPALKQPAQDKN